jgi:predicted AAA+ superfamily ATPase
MAADHTSKSILTQLEQAIRAREYYEARNADALKRESDETFAVIGGVRMSGKTTYLIEWLKQGKAIDLYPGWSRIVLVQDLMRHQHFMDMLRAEFSEGPPPDFYRWVFTFDDIKSTRGWDPNLEVAIDNAESILFQLVSPVGRLTRVTMTAQTCQLGSLHTSSS